MHAAFLAQLAETVRAQSRNALVFDIQVMGSTERESLVARFRPIGAGSMASLWTAVVPS
jgi:hypothetical protein